MSKIRLFATAFFSAAAIAFSASAAIAANTLTIYGTATGESGPQYTAGTILQSDTVQLNNGATVGGSANLVDNGTLLFNQSAGNLLTISNTVSGNGTLTLMNSGTLQLSGTAPSTRFIPLNMTINANSGVLTGSGTTQATQNTIFQLGVGGTGTLNIAGGLVTGTSWHVGVGSNSVGTVNVSSGTFAPKGSLFLGGTVGGTGGSGTLNITGGLVGDTGFGDFLIAASSVASGTGSTGLITITNGTFGSSSNLYIGDYGSGTVTLNSGGFLKVGQAVLGNGSAAQGTLNLLGGTATGVNTVVVGGTGSGVLTVNGSLYQARNATIGQSVGSNGTVTVTSGTWLNNAYGIGSEIAGYLVVGGSGTGSLTIDNGGYVTVSGTFSRGANGTFALNQGGTLQIGSANGNNNPFTTASGTSGVLVGDLNYAGTLKFAQNRNGVGGSNVSTYGNILSGSGDLIKTGTGTLNLTGNNSYSGGTKIEAGRISLGSANAIGTTGTISFSTTGTGPGALQFTAANTTDYSSRFSNAANQKYAIDTNGQDVTLASDLTSVGGSFTKFGAGSATLSGANTFTSGSVAAGTLIGTASNLSTSGLLGSGSGAEVRFNQATSGTFAGSFAGAGALTKLGAGTLTIGGSSSTNTTGTWTVSEGTLAGTTGGIKGAITNNSSVVFDQTTAGTYAGIMSGSGSLTKLGSGTVTLSGANTYSGGTTVSAGSLVGTTTNLQGDITNNAAVSFNNPANGTYAGIMTGAGSLTKLGAGSVTLTGANTYSGGTTISSGSLIGTTTSLQGNITANATLTFDQTTNGTYAGNISGTGILTKLGSGAVTLTGTSNYTGGTTVSAGSLIGTTDSLQGAITNNAAVTFSQTTSGTYAGILSGNGSLTKLGGGSVVLSGNNSYTGATTVSGGSLVINGALTVSAVTVQNLATLGGSGTIGSSVTVQSGGTISPGNSPGLLTVGSLDLQAGSTTLMQIIGVGSAAGIAGTDYDKLAITTAGGLGYGGTLDLDFANTVSFADGTTFDLFGFTGSPTGTHFSTVVSTGSGSYSGLNFLGVGGVWTALLGSQTLTFSELSGLLSFQSSAPVPEIDPTSFGSALTLLIGSLGLLERRARRRTRS